MIKNPTHLLVDGGVASGGGSPHLFEERLADGVRHVDGGVRVGAQNHPDRETEAQKKPEGNAEILLDIWQQADTMRK